MKISPSLSSRYLLSLATLALADSLSFTRKAAEHVDVSYSNRGYTEMSVAYSPGDILSSDGEVLLETKSGGDCWRRVPERLRNRKSGRLIWRVAVFPCLEYSLRLVLEREDCQEELSLGPLVPLSEEKIIEAGYRPLPPSQARLSATEAGQILLNFTAVPCADHYELFYESEDGESGSKNFSRGMTEDLIHNMKLNSSYRLTLSSYLGQEWSNLELTWPDITQATTEEEKEEEDDCSRELKICPPPVEPLERSGAEGGNSSSSESASASSAPLVVPLLVLTLLALQ